MTATLSPDIGRRHWAATHALGHQAPVRLEIGAIAFPLHLVGPVASGPWPRLWRRVFAVNYRAGVRPPCREND